MGIALATGYIKPIWNILEMMAIISEVIRVSSVGSYLESAQLYLSTPLYNNQF